MKTLTIFDGLWGQKNSFGIFLRPNFQKRFSLNLFFSILNFKMFRNMPKMRQKLRNGQNLPHKNPNLTNFFFRINFTYNLSHSTGLRPHYQNNFFYFFFFLFEAPECLRTCVFGVTNCVMPKQAQVQLLHGQINLDIYNKRKKS